MSSDADKATGAAEAEERAENLVDRAGNSDVETPDEEIRKHLEGLTPEQAEIFVQSLELILRRRRLRIFGYAAALGIFVSSMAGAVYLYGTRDPGTFMGWVVLVPFALIGIVFMVVGRLEKRLKPPLRSREGDAARDKLAKL